MKPKRQQLFKPADAMKKQSSAIHLAKQILHGEFVGASAILTSHLYRELGWQKNPLCQRAAEKLRLDFLKANPPKGNFRNA
jgi:hypothetical protein